MCNYCGYEHGMIGDVVCPIKQRFPRQYQQTPFFHWEASWYNERLSPIIVVDSVYSEASVNKKEFQDHMVTLKYKRKSDPRYPSNKTVGDIAPEKIPFYKGYFKDREKW